MKKPWFKDGNKPRSDRREDSRRDDTRRDAPRREERARDDRSRDDRRSSAPRRDDKKPFGKKPFEKRGFDATRTDARPPKAPVPPRPVAEAAPQANARLSGPLLWGIHAVRAAWANPKRRIIRLLVSEHGREALADVLDAPAPAKRPQPEIVDKILFDRLLPAGAVHQGVAAMVEALETRDAHDLIADLKPDDAATIVILDQVTDPHNVGAILRSASALGARGVILQDRHAPELTGVLAKTACGAVDVLPVALETNLSRCIEQLQENGFFVVGLDERGTPITELPRHNRVALVLGAEGEGLRRLVAEHCDTLIALPTRGPIFSLNVSNAAAVALYALL